MALAPLRKDNTCLNCGSAVPERFCSHCGQENIEGKKTFLQTISSLFGDYFLYDSKFFASIVPLFFKPGLITKEYNNGKREKYVHPLRFYVFVSILFFYFMPMSNSNNEKKDDGVKLSLGKIIIQNKSAYLDSIAKLPEKEQPGWAEKIIDLQVIKANESGVEKFTDNILHNIPKMMFFLLPIAAIILALLYWRTKLYFSDHFIFSLHLHSFSFLLFLFSYLMSLVNESLGDIFSTIVVIYLFLYLYLSLKKVYGQSKRKTFIKYFLFLTLYLFSLTLCFIANAALSFFQI